MQVSALEGESCTVLGDQRWSSRNCCVVGTATAVVFDTVDPRAWREAPVCAFRDHMAHSWVVGAFLEREPQGALVDEEEAPEKRLAVAVTVQNHRKVPSFSRITLV